MIFHYGLRLLCLCLASFFLVNAAAGLTTAFASRGLLRMAETMRPRCAARLLFAARVLPWALGAGAVLALCVPSYLWLEPQAIDSWARRGPAPRQLPVPRAAPGRQIEDERHSVGASFPPFEEARATRRRSSNLQLH